MEIFVFKETGRIGGLMTRRHKKSGKILPESRVKRKEKERGFLFLFEKRQSLFLYFDKVTVNSNFLSKIKGNI